MQASYTLTPAEVVRANQLLFRAWRYCAFISCVFGAWITIVFVAQKWPLSDLGDFLYCLACGALGGVVLGPLTTALQRFVLIPWRTRWLVRQHPLVYGEMRLTADDEGVELRGPRQVARYAWPDFKGVKADAAVTVLCLSQVAGLAIPKRALGPDEQRSLAELVAQHLARLR